MVGSDRSVSASTITVSVAVDGRFWVRPAGSLLRQPELLCYLRAGVRAGAPEPFSFVWLPATAEPSWVRFGECRPDGGRTAEVTPAAAPQLAGLSRRELQVLTLLACGETNPQIAARLGVARRTVATHVERLLTKLDVGTRAAAGALALDRGLLALPLPGGDLGHCAPVGPVRIELAVRSAGPPDRRPRRSDRTLVIGGVYPSNAEWRDDGRQMQRGAELAIAELNRAGGVAGHRVEHLPLCVDVSSMQALNGAADELTARDVDAVTFGYTLQRAPQLLGEFFARATAGGAPLLHHTTSAGAASIVRESPGQFGRVFQMCAPESAYGLGFIRCLNELRDSRAWHPVNRRVLVIDNLDPNLITFPDHAVEAAQHSGWQPTVRNLDLMAPDWSPVLAAVGEQDPVAVMVGCFSPEHTARLLRRLGRRDLIIYALYSPSVPEFAEQAGSAAEGLVWATVTGRYGDALGAAFARDYRRRFATTPGLSSAGVHYDMVQLLAAAWAQAGVPKDYAKVTARLRQVVHRGVNGAYQLSGSDQTNRAYPEQGLDPSLAQAQLVYQIQDGRHQIISPAIYATAPFRPPGP